MIQFDYNIFQMGWNHQPVMSLFNGYGNHHGIPEHLARKPVAISFPEVRADQSTQSFLEAPSLFNGSHGESL